MGAIYEGKRLSTKALLLPFWTGEMGWGVRSMEKRYGDERTEAKDIKPDAYQWLGKG